MGALQLVQELLPDVEDAPVLGGHNRQPRASSQQPPAQAEVTCGQDGGYKAPMTRARQASGETCEDEDDGRECPMDACTQARKQDLHFGYLK